MTKTVCRNIWPPSGKCGGLCGLVTRLAARGLLVFLGVLRGRGRGRLVVVHQRGLCRFRCGLSFCGGFRFALFV